MGKSIMQYAGGKGILVAKLLKYIPEHTIYAEIFGGAGNILFNKRPAQYEIYNDINSNVVNLFRVLRDDEKVKKLKHLLEYTPVSREEFYNFKQQLKENDNLTDVERAYYYLYIKNTCFGGIERGSSNYGFSLTENSRIKKYNNKIKNIDLYIKRLKNTHIEHLDFRKFFNTYIRHWNYKDAFVYLDPPYLHETRQSLNLYKNEMSNEDHITLLEYITKDFKDNAKYMLSGYDNELYNTYLKDWVKLKFDTVCHLTKTTKNTTIKNNNFSRSRTECIWMNYSLYKTIF